jgi:hypothetical protein
MGDTPGCGYPENTPCTRCTACFILQEAADVFPNRVADRNILALNPEYTVFPTVKYVDKRLL